MQSQNVAKPWSIAIHGGAGGDPKAWGPEKCDARMRALGVALTAGRDVLAAGGTALDAIEAAVTVLEDDGNFHAGRGATLTSTGNVELDASIMDGASANCGAVAAMNACGNPIRVARRVMQQTSHVLLVGPGADAFAQSQGFPLAPPDYFLGTRTSTRDATSDGDPNFRFGTVGCVARDTYGDLASGTSTSGTNEKLPGRVGDSPIIGAGTFAANSYGAVSTTGLGEEFMRRCVAYDLIAQVRYAGRTLDEATSETIRRQLPVGTGGIIAIDAVGTITLAHNTPGMSWGAADHQGRFETGLRVNALTL